MAITVMIANSKPSIVSQSRLARCCEQISVYIKANINVLGDSCHVLFSVLLSVKIKRKRKMHVNYMANAKLNKLKLYLLIKLK